MSVLFRGHQSSISWCVPRPVNSAEVVCPNMAITPAQIAQMTRQGIAVSTPNADNFFYESNSGWDIEPVYQRYYDRNTAWETSNVSKSNILRARKTDSEKYK